MEVHHTRDNLADLSHMKNTRTCFFSRLPSTNTRETSTLVHALVDLCAIVVQQYPPVLPCLATSVVVRTTSRFDEKKPTEPRRAETHLLRHGVESEIHGRSAPFQEPRHGLHGRAERATKGGAQHQIRDVFLLSRTWCVCISVS